MPYKWQHRHCNLEMPEGPGYYHCGGEYIFHYPKYCGVSGCHHFNLNFQPKLTVGKIVAIYLLYLCLICRVEGDADLNHIQEVVTRSKGQF